MNLSRKDITDRINQPHELERMYRGNKSGFKQAFFEAFPEINTNPIAMVWKERFNFEGETAGVSWGTRGEWLRVIILCLLAGTIAKLPKLFSIDDQFFYSRNIGFIVFPLLCVYFIWQKGLVRRRIIYGAITIAITTVYINVLPDAKSDTLILACIHLVVMLWSMAGVAFAGEKTYDHTSRFNYLKYFADMLVMCALLALAFGIFSGITIGLFEVIGVKIEEFYFKYVVIYVLAGAPLISSHLVRSNPQMVNKVSPVIARVFTPVLLVTLIIYLIAWAGSGKDPYNDREFLFVFNMLLLGVLAIVFFSVIEMTQGEGSRYTLVLLLALTVVTIIVNSVALSAIVFRIAGMGITPNRAAVAGSNVLILSGMVALAYRLYLSLKNDTPASDATRGITQFLPWYGIWAAVVVFLFPLLFRFR